MARVLGAAVKMVSRRPRVRVVVMEGTLSAPSLVESFELTTSEAAIVEQVHDLATNFGNRVTGLAPDRVMIQRADYFRIASNADGPRVRLIAEGALAGAARTRVKDTQMKSGRDVAHDAGENKDVLLAAARAVVSDDAFVEAASAAIAILDP